MGLIGSRNRSDPDVENLSSAASYRYPPKAGNYFGMHFMLGGERFETSQPESYLFGENGDLNFFGTRPVPFPYPTSPSSNEPTRTLQSLVNIRRDSVKFVRCPAHHQPLMDQSALERDNLVSECEKASVPSSSTRSSLSYTSKTERLGLQSNNNSTDSGVSFRIPNVPTPSEPTDNDNNQMLKSSSTTAQRRKSSDESATPVVTDADSVRVSGDFVDTSDEEDTDESTSIATLPRRYNLEFTFDADCPVRITVYYFAMEDVSSSSGVTYLSQRPELTSDTYTYPMGEGQIFSQPNLIFDPSAFRANLLRYDPESDLIPVVIHCVAENHNQSHSTMAIVEPSSEGHDYLLKPLKQKLFVDNVGYLLQEIYGIENKKNQQEEPSKSVPDEAGDDGGHECVICMSEIRDTLILPCRHLCLCSTCAETLRYKASNCPICRSPFRALLQIKTLKKSKNSSFQNAFNSSTEQNSNDSGFLYRYETVTLVEALNGQILKTPSAPAAIQRRSSNSSGTQDPAGKSPMPPPRAAGKHGKKGLRRAVSPIQEVLTVPHTVTPVCSGKDPEFMHSQELPGAVNQLPTVESEAELLRSPSISSKGLGGYNNRSFCSSSGADSENASTIADADESLEPNSGPYRIVVNSSAALLSSIDPDEGTPEPVKNDVVKPSSTGYEFVSSQLKRPTPGNRRPPKGNRLSRSSEDIRHSISFELNDSIQHQSGAETQGGTTFSLSGEGLPASPRLEVDTPATTRSGTPASNHSFSSVSSTKPLLKQNDSLKNFDDDAC